MKLIIDIPDNTYKDIKEYYEKNDIVEATYSYIYYGIPLDRIRAEIAEYADRLKDSLYGDGMRHCIDIIDKCRAESEEV